MNGFGDFFKSLEGREFKEFYLNLKYAIYNLIILYYLKYNKNLLLF